MLTPSSAVDELDRLMNSRPDAEDVLARLKWERANSQRVADLEAYILSNPSSAPVSAPVVVPAPVEAPEVPAVKKVGHKRTTGAPASQVASILSRLENATDEALVAKDKRTFGKCMGRIHQLRFQIRRISTESGLPIPRVPELPRNPWVVVVPNLQARVDPPRPAYQKPSLPVDPVKIALPANHAASSRSIAQLRRSVWLLIAALEVMPPEDRILLGDELQLLTYAAKSARDLCLGKAGLVSADTQGSDPLKPMQARA